MRVSSSIPLAAAAGRIDSIPACTTVRKSMRRTCSWSFPVMMRDTSSRSSTIRVCARVLRSMISSAWDFCVSATAPVRSMRTQPVDRVQGGAQLVRDRHQELVLQAARRFQVRPGLLLPLHDGAQLGVGRRPRGGALLHSALEGIVHVPQRRGVGGATPLVALEQRVDPHQQRPHQPDDRRPQHAGSLHGGGVGPQSRIAQHHLVALHLIQGFADEPHHVALLDRSCPVATAGLCGNRLRAGPGCGCGWPRVSAAARPAAAAAGCPP